MNPWELAQKQLDQELGVQAAGPVESQKARAFAQGATFGYAENIEALVRSILPESLGGGEYEQLRDELRQKLAAYKEANPTEALTYELAGALVPGIATMAVPGMQALGPMRLAGVAGLEGLAAYGGQMEGAPTMEDIPGAGVAAGVSAVGGPIVQKAVGATGGLFSRFVNIARETLGDKPATAVQAELRRLAEGTGKTVDEIVQDVIDGKIMAENRTLQAAVRALRSKGGEAGALITETLPARRTATRQAAVEGMQEGLAPGMESNVIRAMKATDEQLGDIERQSYQRVFGEIPETSPDIARNMQDILQRFGDVRSSLSKLYNERNIVPLFSESEAGELVLRRMPTLEDAEILRRAMDEQATSLFRAGEGARGQVAADSAQALRGQLDEAFPQLRSVRESARIRRVIRDQFQEGRKALGMNADELEVKFEEVQGMGDAAVRAFRAGVMDGIRNRVRRSPGIMARLADPDRQEGSILRIVYPEDSVDQIQRKLDIAAGSQELYDRVLFNSMTAPEQAAASQIGTSTSIEDVRRIAGGDVMAVINWGAKKLAQAMPQLSDAQRADVTRVLLTEDPQLVMRALTDNTAVDEMLRRAAQVANVAGAGVRTVFGQQAARGAGLLSEGNE